MNMFVQAIQPDLIFLNVVAKDQKQAISYLANQLIQKQIVKPSYLEAILNREQDYPTGLQTQGGGVAIPHTDPSHVNLEAVTIGVLKQPVTFRLMENPGQSIEVDLIFMLAMKEPNSQIEMLQALVSIFQDPHCLAELRRAQSADQVLRVLEKVEN